MSSLLARLARYAGVSAIATTTSLTVLAALVATGASSAGWANVAATAAGTVPSFELNRRWVWRRNGRPSIGREIAPFCALSFAGLALSTLAVSAATGWVSRSGYPVAIRTITAVGANLATFGSLWLVQFMVLDRLLFASRNMATTVAIDRQCRADAMRSAA